MNKILKWIIISGFGLLMLFVAALVFAIAGPRPDVVEGTERPSWIAISAFLMLLPLVGLIPSIGRQALLLFVVACLAAVPSVVSIVSHTSNHQEP